VPVSDRAPVDHRVGVGRAEARLDPRLPHGRAGHHLLRPRPAQGVPRRARGHHRRHPGRHRRGRDHRRRRRPARRRTAPRSPRSASGSANPLTYRKLIDNVSGWFTEHPIYDSEGPADRGARVEVPRSRQGRGPAARAQKVLTGPRRCSRRSRCAASRPSGRPRSRASGRRSSGRSVRRALRRSTPSARRSTRSTPARAVGRTLDEADQETFAFDPASSTGTTTSRDPPAPRSSSTPGSRPRPGVAGHRPDDRLRKQVLDPKRHVAAFDLENTLIASNVVESYSWLATRRLPGGPDAVRAAHAGRGAGLLKLDRKRPHRLPAPLLPALRGRPGRADRAEDHREMFSQLILTKSFPEGHPPGARAPGARAPHGADHRCARLRRRRLPRCSTRSSPPR
jgi:alcohol-forming fatty acyl-CoA reductase